MQLKESIYECLHSSFESSTTDPIPASIDWKNTFLGAPNARKVSNSFQKSTYDTSWVMVATGMKIASGDQVMIEAELLNYKKLCLMNVCVLHAVLSMQPE